MRWWLCATLLLCLALLAESMAQQQKTKRRKMRKRKINTSTGPTQVEEKVTEEAAQDEMEEAVEDVAASLEPVRQEDRNARGFLDQYYQQFDQRVQPSLERSDFSGIESPSISPSSSPVSSVPTDSTSKIQLQDGTSSRSLPTVYLSNTYPDSIDSVADAPSAYQPIPTSSISKAALPSPYLKPVPLPSQYSKVNKDITFTTTSSLPSTSSSDSKYKRTFTLPGHSSSSAGFSGGYGVPDSTNYIDDSYKDVSYTTKPAASKYFGVATTTSQDIQLGLTFTVPFLSIPLSGLTDIFSGAGDSLGGLFNGFDTSNLVIIAVVAIGAIFILPQILYWLTGVNLSAFNWGRSDDPNFVLNLANTVDRALSDYDINMRQCLSHVMCNEMKKRGKTLDKVQGKTNEKEDEGSSITDMLGYGIIRQAAKSQTVKSFLGEARVNEIVGVSDSEYKCEQVFSDSTCPWHPSTSKKIVAKLILDSDLDLGTMANLAMQGAKAFS